METWASRFARTVSDYCGRSYASVVACAIIVLWLLAGPIFGWSDSWQLVINTGTTIITFVMVFSIQHSQNHDTAAIQLKLDELIRAEARASDWMQSIEDLPDEQLRRVGAQRKPHG